jgi:hypothetical protein
MTDIVERLRESDYGKICDAPRSTAKLCTEAADNIERLRATLEEVLDLLSDGPGGPRRLTAIKVIQAATRCFDGVTDD